MGLEKSADKLRRAAERRARDGDEARRDSDAESAAAHGELIRPGESKGRPPLMAAIAADPRTPAVRPVGHTTASGAGLGRTGLTQSPHGADAIAIAAHHALELPHPRDRASRSAASRLISWLRSGDWESS